MNKIRGTIYSTFQSIAQNGLQRIIDDINDISIKENLNINIADIILILERDSSFKDITLVQKNFFTAILLYYIVIHIAEVKKLLSIETKQKIKDMLNWLVHYIKELKEVQITQGLIKKYNIMELLHFSKNPSINTLDDLLENFKRIGILSSLENFKKIGILSSNVTGGWTQKIYLF
jgi:hypothetical protein